MKRFIIFDTHCSICTQLALTIRESSDGKLEALSIHDNEAKTLLDRAYPEGWEHAPYLVTVEGEKVRAWTGFSLAFQLMRLIGIRNAWSVWRLARNEGVILAPEAKRLSAFNPRRQFLKTGLVAMFATMISGKVSVAHACIPCHTCALLWYERWCGCSLSCGSDYQPCTRWDIYDGQTGEYCGSACGNPCACCGCGCV